MLVAHVVPGYFIGAHVVEKNKRRWSRSQRALIWAVGLLAAVAPDTDVVFNALLRGFVNHSTLWTHSLFPFLALLTLGFLAQRRKANTYLLGLLGVFIAGGLSHLLLDAISHGTPLLYPLSLHMFGAPSPRILYGGVRAYITDPLFLLEPALLTVAALHWLARHVRSAHALRLSLGAAVVAWLLFCSAFLALLPALRHLIVR